MKSRPLATAACQYIPTMATGQTISEGVTFCRAELNLTYLGRVEAFRCTFGWFRCVFVIGEKVGMCVGGGVR